MLLPDPLKKLADRLAELPSIGPRQAIRLAFYLVNQGKNEIDQLAADIDDLKKLKICERCFFVHQNQGNLCGMCGDTKRNQSIIAIVEKETDLISIENTKKFNGRYLILGPISKTGILGNSQKLRLQGLKSFIQKELNGLSVYGEQSRTTSSGGQADEIILAFNPTSSGDFNTTLITKELSPFTKKISRLGRGLPTGGEIEFADDETLGAALLRRD